MADVGRWREALLVGLDAANEGAFVPCLETLGFHCSQAPRRGALDMGRFDIVFIAGAYAAPLDDAAAIVWVVDAATDEARYPLSGDWIDRPIRPLAVRAVVERVLARRALEQRIAALTRKLELELPAPTLIAESGAMRRFLAGATPLARDQRPLVLCGPRGVGRGFVAQLLADAGRPGLHELRGRRLRKPAALAEVHLALDAVARGTLIVRDVDEASEEVQLALATRLRDGARAKVILTAAVTKSLRRELRQLLHDRELAVPSLRDRSGDLEPLARHFLAHYAPAAHFTRAALGALAAYRWPGEVAELRLVTEACALAGRGDIDVLQLPERVLGSSADGRYVGGEFTLAEIEWAHVSTVLASGRSLQEVAQLLGIDSSTLWRLRKRHAHG